DALIGLGPVVLVEVREVETVAPADWPASIRFRTLGHLESGGEHEHIDRMIHPVLSPDAVGGDALNRLRDQVDVVACIRLVVHVRYARALAPEAIRRGQ